LIVAAVALYVAAALVERWLIERGYARERSGPA
jgi:hypothetical protein